MGVPHDFFNSVSFSSAFTQYIEEEEEGEEEADPISLYLLSLTSKYFPHK
jgi:hypothetical protein